MIMQGVVVGFMFFREADSFNKQRNSDTGVDAS
jgi:hypothetical protein